MLTPAEAIHDLDTLFEYIRAAAQEARVVLLPDFYIDHVVATDIEELVQRIQQTAEWGGGNIPTTHTYVIGGNAANTAHALLQLGFHPILIAETSPLGYSLLQQHFPNHMLRIRIGRTASTSVILDGKWGERTVNVMLSDPGPVSAFGPERLSEEEWRLIRDADLVFVGHWNLNQRGTDLLYAVCKEATGITYADLGDIRHRLSDVEQLKHCVFQHRLLGVLSVNENEARLLTRVDDPVRAAKQLSRLYSIRVDLHTTDYTASYYLGGGPRVSTVSVEVRNPTGAGDVWNAANIAGYLAGLTIPERLAFANLCAAVYVSDPKRRKPSLDAVYRFAKRYLKSVKP